MERKLASVQRVLEIVPIEGADAIELARINGWQCVVKKGEFQAGDLGVYLEIDAVPPDREPWKFLWTPRPKADDNGNEIAVEVPPRPDKFRIRTLKLRGALSQGLLMPLNQFELGVVEAGEDVTAQLEVEKYEPPVIMMGDVEMQAFPSWVPKTDEIRVQSEPQVLAELRGQPYFITLKYDGTSATYTWHPQEDHLVVCGRNYSFPPCENAYWKMARDNNLEEILRAHPDLAIQGEIVGPGIQKNPLGLKRVSFFAFNVYNWREGRHLDADEARQFLNENGVPMVDIVERGDDFQHTQESLLGLAEGKYPGTSNEREGIVIRPQHETRSETLAGRLSFKAISNRYLLKERD